jgi:hypothetical protein
MMEQGRHTIERKCTKTSSTLNLCWYVKDRGDAETKNKTLTTSYGRAYQEGRRSSSWHIGGPSVHYDHDRSRSQLAGRIKPDDALVLLFYRKATQIT